MPEPPDYDGRPEPRKPLEEEVGAREVRKLRARGEMDRTLWFGLGMFGLVGWSVAVPTLAGTALGVWLDRVWPQRFSWTLTLLLAGMALGCANAWYWLSREQRNIDREGKDRR